MEAWEHTHSFLETANHTVARDEIKYLVSDPIKARNRIFKKYSGLTHFAKNLRAGAEKIGLSLIILKKSLPIETDVSTLILTFKLAMQMLLHRLLS